MQAIVTKYIPPTDRRGSRIKASCERGSITLSWPDELSGDECHRFAVRELCARFIEEDVEKYGNESRAGNVWGVPFVTAGLADGSRVHVGLNSWVLGQAGVVLEEGVVA